MFTLLKLAVDVLIYDFSTVDDNSLIEDALTTFVVNGNSWPVVVRDSMLNVNSSVEVSVVNSEIFFDVGIVDLEYSFCVSLEVFAVHEVKCKSEEWFKLLETDDVVSIGVIFNPELSLDVGINFVVTDCWKETLLEPVLRNTYWDDGTNDDGNNLEEDLVSNIDDPLDVTVDMGKLAFWTRMLLDLLNVIKLDGDIADNGSAVDDTLYTISVVERNSLVLTLPKLAVDVTTCDFSKVVDGNNFVSDTLVKVSGNEVDVIFLVEISVELGIKVTAGLDVITPASELVRLTALSVLRNVTLSVKFGESIDNV